MPQKFSKEDAIAAADTVYDHANRTAVVILFHQFNTDPKRARIQCVRHDRMGSATQQMSDDGYTFGKTNRQYLVPKHYYHNCHCLTFDMPFKI